MEANQRLSGVIIKWDEARGFGFIAQDKMGLDVFVHIHDLKRRGVTPQVGDRVEYGLVRQADGKLRAKSVVMLGAKAPPGAWSGPAKIRWLSPSYLPIPAFALFALWVAWRWGLPSWVPWVYGLASVIAFGLYAVDKATALDRAWRIPESTLLLAGLLGGWPGALLAQHLLRHKSSKPSFLAEFWATAALNVLAFAFAFTPFYSFLAKG